MSFLIIEFGPFTYDLGINPLSNILFGNIFFFFNLSLCFPRSVFKDYTLIYELSSFTNSANLKSKCHKSFPAGPCSEIL